MVGLMQIMIYLLAIYLVYKGVEIFQVALVSPQSNSRLGGIIIGVVAIAAAVLIGVFAVASADGMATSVSDKMQNIGR
jgi:uncharacterized membrane protein HdeD (DUF308 family)